MFLLSGALACREQRAGNTTSTSSGTKSIGNKGSDTLVNLALAWAELYMQEHPEMRKYIKGWLKRAETTVFL